MPPALVSVACMGQHEIGQGWWREGVGRNPGVRLDCTHHRARRCSISFRKLVWNLCKGSKFGNMRLFKASGMESSLLTVLWNHWEREGQVRGDSALKPLGVAGTRQRDVCAGQQEAIHFLMGF